MAHLTLSPLERRVLQLLLDDERVWLTASELTAGVAYRYMAVVSALGHLRRHELIAVQHRRDGSRYCIADLGRRVLKCGFMPDFTQLEIDIMRLLAQHGAWMTFDELCAGLEHLDGGSAHDRTRVHAALSYLTRSRYAVRAFAERGGRTFMLGQRGAAEIAARDQLRLSA